MDLIVEGRRGAIEGQARLGDRHYACRLGRSGIVSDKTEGDGATPVGRFPLRQVFYRPDRGPAPRTSLPCRALAQTDGWCDDPASPHYNRAVTLPFTPSALSLSPPPFALSLSPPPFVLSLSPPPFALSLSKGRRAARCNDLKYPPSCVLRQAQDAREPRMLGHSSKRVGDCHDPRTMP